MATKTTKASKTPVNIHAQPDGQVHFSEAQLAIIAEYEATNPLPLKTNFEEIKNPNLGLKSYGPNVIALLDYVDKIIAGDKINFDKWEDLVKAVHSGSLVAVIPEAMYRLHTHLTPQSSYQLIDMVHLYSLAFNFRESFHVRHDLMYQIVFYHLANMDKAAFIKDIKDLYQRYASQPLVQESLLALFPDELNLTVSQITSSLANFYREQVVHFINRPDIFTKIYELSHAFYYHPEPMLLYILKHHGITILRPIEMLLRYANRYNPRAKWQKGEYTKIRKNFNLLDNYHHVDILNFFINHAHESEVVSKYLQNWLKRFPLFTLQKFLEKFHTLESAKKETIKALIINYLSQNMTQIPLLKQQITENQLTLLNSFIPHLTEDMIQQAIIEQATPTAKKSATSKTATENAETPKVLKFPDLVLNRITEPATFDLTLLKERHRKSVSEYEERNFANIMSDLDKYLFPYYQNSRFADRLPELKANYANFDETQKILVHLGINPTFITSDNYQKALQGDYTLTVSDFIDIDARDYDWRNTLYPVGFKSLPPTLAQAILLGDFPLMQTALGKDEYSMGTFLEILRDIFVSATPKQINNLLTKYLPALRQSKAWLLHILIGIASYQVVPDFLHIFTTKKYNGWMNNYVKNHPQTVINEVLYLLFTKQTEDTLKKAKKNAKLYLDWLIDNGYSEQIMATAQAYDQQLTKPTIAPFIEQYLAQRQTQNQKLDTAKNANPNDFAVNSEGVPEILLNDNWLKLTTRKSVNLPTNHVLTDLPSLVLTSNNQPLPFEAQQTVLKMLYASDIGEPIAPLLPVLAFFTHDSQSALAKAMWQKSQAIGKDKWLRGASAWLYRNDLASTVWQSIRDYEKGGWAKSPKAVATEFAILADHAIIQHQLAKQDPAINPHTAKHQQIGDTALRMLIKISQKARPSLRRPAQDELQRYAKALNLTADDLADRILPTLGLDAHGKRVFDYGSRQFTMRLNSDLEPEFFDETGKKFKNLPSATTKDDSSKVNQAQAEFKNIKAELKAFKGEDVPRIELMMTNQRRISFGDFEQFYIKNPLMLRYTSQLIWGIYSGEDKSKLVTPFRVVETGEILDINDDSLSITDDSLIGLIHPLDLTDEQKAKLGQSLQDDNIMQPFMQLSRPIFRLTDEEKAKKQITRFHNERFDVKGFLGLKNQGWTPYTNDSYVGGFSKTMGGVLWTFSIEGYRVYSHVGYEVQTVQDIQIPDGANDVSISEMIYAVDSIARV